MFDWKDVAMAALGVIGLCAMIALLDQMDARRHECYSPTAAAMVQP